MKARLTYANIVATLCLALLLSGSAYAAATQLSKDSVRSKHIKNDTVKSKDIRDGGIKPVDLRADVLAGVVRDGDLADVVRDAELDADLAAAVADLVSEGQLDTTLAAALEDYVAGDRDDASLTLPGNGSSSPLVALPDVISVTTSCYSAGPNRGIEVSVTNDSPASWPIVVKEQSETPSFDTLDSDTMGPNDTLQVVFPPDSALPSARHLSVTALGAVPVEVEIDAVTTTLAGGCVVRGSVFLDGGPA